MSLSNVQLFLRQLSVLCSCKRGRWAVALRLPVGRFRVSRCAAALALEWFPVDPADEPRIRWVSAAWFCTLDSAARGEVMASFLRPPASSGGSGPGPRSLTDKAFAKAYPALWEWLPATAYPDGSARQTSTVTQR